MKCAHRLFTSFDASRTERRRRFVASARDRIIVFREGSSERQSPHQGVQRSRCHHRSASFLAPSSGTCLLPRISLSIARRLSHT